MAIDTLDVDSNTDLGEACSTTARNVVQHLMSGRGADPCEPITIRADAHARVGLHGLAKCLILRSLEVAVWQLVRKRPTFPVEASDEFGKNWKRVATSHARPAAGKL